MQFFDLKSKKKFSTEKYTTFKRSVRGRTVTFAQAIAPSGSKATRIMSNTK